MASEVIYVPDDSLDEMIMLIRLGIEHAQALGCKLNPDTVEGLRDWCDTTEEYLNSAEAS